MKYAILGDIHSNLEALEAGALGHPQGHQLSHSENATAEPGLT